MSDGKIMGIDEDAICQECGKEWNSEYHMSDQCVNFDEDLLKERWQGRKE